MGECLKILNYYVDNEFIASVLACTHVYVFSLYLGQLRFMIPAEYSSNLSPVGTPFQIVSYSYTVG
jgi:hypothetical protein